MLSIPAPHSTLDESCQQKFGKKVVDGGARGGALALAAAGTPGPAQKSKRFLHGVRDIENMGGVYDMRGPSLGPYSKRILLFWMVLL